MGTVTVNIAFQESLLREIDDVSQSESRSRSEFLREAGRVIKALFVVDVAIVNCSPIARQ